MKKITLAIVCLSLAITSHSQNGELPPVNFPSGKNVCDNSPWQLVFQDYFDGNKLQSPWITFNSWAGMTGGDNDNWGEGRKLPQIGITKDDNIIVSNGTVKLQVKRESATWQCASCGETPLSSKYTGAMLNLPYTRSFNAGKFEATMKFPTFKYAHGTFWLWAGQGLDVNDPNSRGVNEIDIAEAYGTSGSPAWPIFGYAPTCNYSLHAWEPGVTPASNPYQMTHVEVANRAPHQSWTDWFFGRYFKPDIFHTYTCEWDTALIRFYIDGNKVSEQWKYYQERSYKKWWNPFTTYHYLAGSDCQPDAGSWRVMKGFPYNNHSMSNLRFTMDVDKEDASHSGYLGQMEIEYVKIWEKHPENGWHNVCDPTTNTISGPEVICNTATYTANPPSPNGTWFVVSSNLILLSSNNTSCTVQKKPSATGGEGFVYYVPYDNSCPLVGNPFLNWKRAYVGTPDNVSTICSETHNTTNHTVHYNLHADPNYIALPNSNYNYTSPMTYEWNIDYGPNFSRHHHIFGQTVSTPNVTYTPNTTNSVRWTLTVTNECGSTTKTGSMNYFLNKKAPDESTDHDPNNHYVVAEIPDDEIYQKAVLDHLGHTFIANDADDITISSIIEKIELDELQPYLILEDSDIPIDDTAIAPTTASRGINGNTAALALPETVIYPNPTSREVVVFVDKNFQNDAQIEISVLDLSGNVVLFSNSRVEQGRGITVDLSSLSNAPYMIQLKQGKHSETHKIVKQ